MKKSKAQSNYVFAGRKVNNPNIIYDYVIIVIPGHDPRRVKILLVHVICIETVVLFKNMYRETQGGRDVTETEGG